MSANDILERLRESLREVVLCMDAAAEIERLRVADGMLRHGIRQLELDLSVKITEAERLHTEIGRRIQDKRESDGRVMAAMEIDERQRAEIERLRASEAQHIADLDAIWLWAVKLPPTAWKLRSDECKAALARAYDRRAKKEASDESKR